MPTDRQSLKFSQQSHPTTRRFKSVFQPLFRLVVVWKVNRRCWVGSSDRHLRVPGKMVVPPSVELGTYWLLVVAYFWVESRKLWPDCHKWRQSQFDRGHSWPRYLVRLLLCSDQLLAQFGGRVGKDGCYPSLAEEQLLVSGFLTSLP